MMLDPVVVPAQPRTHIPEAVIIGPTFAGATDDAIAYLIP
jgi:hypothetical protein